MDAKAPTTRTTVKRHADRAVYERETIEAILDEALYCHVAVVHEGSPRVIPTIHARIGGTLYIHGSNASRTLALPRRERRSVWWSRSWTG